MIAGSAADRVVAMSAVRHNDHASRWRSGPVALSKFIFLFAVALGVAALAWIFQFWLLGSPVSPPIGDYFKEADWGLLQAAHGHLFSLFAVSPYSHEQPLMMPLSLLIRAVALAAGAAVHVVNLHSQVNYKGTLPTGPASVAARYHLGAVAALAAGLSALVASAWYRGTRSDRVLALTVALTAAAIPLAGSALFWGHPEEFLMGALIAAFLLAASRGMWMLAALMFGLAVATKQPAWLLIPTFPFILPPERRRAGALLAVAVAAVVILPFVLPHLAAVWSSQGKQVGASTAEPSPSSLWGLFRHLGLAGLSQYGRDLTILVAVALPLGVAARNRWRMSVLQGAAVCVIVLLARSAFDPFNVSYYEYPAAAALIALEVHAWRSGLHPFRTSFLARIRPFPLLGAVAAVLLWGVCAEGFISEWTARTRAPGVVEPLLYLLINLIILMPLLLILRGKAVALDRVRVRLYGGLAVAAVVILVAVAVVDAPTVSHMQVPPPANLKAETPGRVAQTLAPEKAYWLRAPALSNGFYLRTSSVEASSGQQMMAFFDYGPSSSSPTSVAVFTFKGTSPTSLPEAIRLCLHPKKPCAGDGYDISTPLGEGLVQRASKSNWVVHIPVGGETVSVASVADLPIAATISRLRAVLASSVALNAS